MAFPPFVIAQLVGWKVVETKPSVRGSVAPVTKDKVKLLLEASFPELPSATPFGREVETLNTWLPAVELIALRVIFAVEFGVNEPVHGYD
jgi:hypothetical protein